MDLPDPSDYISSEHEACGIFHATVKLLALHPMDTHGVHLSKFPDVITISQMV